MKPSGCKSHALNNNHCFQNRKVRCRYCQRPRLPPPHRLPRPGRTSIRRFPHVHRADRRQEPLVAARHGQAPLSDPLQPHRAHGPLLQPRCPQSAERHGFLRRFGVAFPEDPHHPAGRVGKQGTFVQGIHNFPIRSSTSGFLPEATKRVTQELVTPKYRATSAPE
jgi:hypothetical protein